MRKSIQLAPETVLLLLNPARQHFIELEDMVSARQKSLLLRVPADARETVREVLQEFVFSRRSFLMPQSEFVANYRAKASSTFVPATHRATQRTQCSSSFASRECTPAHSPVPDRSWDRSGSQSPLDTSYTELHEKRKQIRKQLNARDLVTAVRVDSQLKKARTPSLIVKRETRPVATEIPTQRVRPSPNPLIEIRRRHLSSLCSEVLLR